MIRINLIKCAQTPAERKRERLRVASLKFARSAKGLDRRKGWRDAHPENIRAATAGYRARMTPEERKQVSKKHRDNPQTKMRHRLNEARKRAARDGLEFDNALYAYVLANMPEWCASCNSRLDYNTVGRGCRNRSPSFDRVDNAQGYLLKNVQYLCGRCNALKSDATLDELRALVAYMERHFARVT